MKEKRLFVSVLCIFFLLTSPLLVFGQGQQDSDDNSIHVAQVAWGLDDIFFQTVQDGTKYQLDILSEQKGYTYTRTLDGSNSPEEQVNLLETMLVQNPDYAVFCTVDSNLIGPIEQYNARGIPVITNNIGVYGGKQTFVGFDNRQAGRESARKVIDRLEKKFGKDPADWGPNGNGGIIVELTGDLAMAAAQDRSDGFHDILDPIVKATPNLELIVVEGKWSADISYTRMSDLITKYGNKIIATYTHGDTMTIAGVWPALKNAGMGYTWDDPRHVVMTAIDGTSAALDLVRKKILDSVTIQPAWGEGVVVANLIDSMRENGPEDGIASVGTVLYEDLEKPLIMDLASDEFTAAEIAAGAKPVWAPVEVVEGKVPYGEWDGVWYKTNSTMTCPDDYPADSKLLWGNFWQFLQDGKWAWE
jgi:ABC-type sugar transport system substrate-binding protein